jgi:hypothetical protein
MTVRKALIEAKALIATPERWRKDGKFGYGTECLCALGAVNVVGGAVGRGHLRQALMDELPAPWAEVASFNDHPFTTHADIMALFDRAIAAQPVQP